MDLSVVIPVYNSSARLAALGESLIRMLSGMSILFEIIMVDDGSTDDSAVIIEQMHSFHRQVKGICLKRNMGQHAAIFMGLTHASGRHILIIDDDMMDALDVFPAFWQKMVEGRNVVSGNRTRPPNTIVGRRMLARAINLAVSLIAGRRFRDATSPFKLFRKDLVDALIDRGMRDVLVPEYLMMRGSNVEEIPLPLADPMRAESRYTFGKLLQHGRVLIRTFFFVVAFGPISAPVSTGRDHSASADEIKSFLGFTSLP